MNKMVAKLIAAVLALTVAATLVAATSYAWMTMSGAPEINGIQINIGGSNTLMLAADIAVQNEDGTVSHYPGAFSQTLDFSSYATYDYIDTLTGLLPGSTADGVNWVLPDYYDASDAAVQNGLAIEGQIKNPEDFFVENDLSSANLTPQQLSNTTTGHYIYLDFWVVSPADNYALRISTGSEQEDSGSYVISRMEPVADENGAYILAPADETAAASVRVGFLINEDFASSEDMLCYTGSQSYDARYTRLMGQYAEPGEAAPEQNSFTIYEPNGNLHPKTENDHYSITQPLGIVDGKVQPVSVEDRLSVQLANRWKQAHNGLSTLLEQEFTTAVFGKNTSNMTPQELAVYFYEQRLQGIYTPYLNRGGFVKSTKNLYAAAADGLVAADDPALRATAGATDDAVMTVLPKNVPQRIRMFIWLEGQDADCVNFQSVTNLIVNLELAGSNYRS